jgi:RES domain-containing protein
MSINDVIYRIAHGYPGGIKALAARMGKNAAVLQNKVNPNCDTHHPYAEEAAQIADLADSDELAKEHCARRNGVFVPIAKHEGASDMELLDLVIKLNKEQAEMLQAIQQALSDGRVDEKEFAYVKKEAMDHMAANAELLSRVEGMVQDPRTVARGK